MKFKDIKQFTSVGNYEVDVPLAHLERTLSRYEEDYGLELEPDFQRGHVWTREQQKKYLEFFFKGGKTSRIIYFNSPAFGDINDNSDITIVCVDGLQRLTALRSFLNNEILVFEHYYKDFEDELDNTCHSIKFNINSLQTRKEVLTWYLEMNTGGTPHSDIEIARVQKLLESEM